MMIWYGWYGEVGGQVLASMGRDGDTIALAVIEPNEKT